MEKYDESPRIFYENKGQVNLKNTERKVVGYLYLNRISKQSNGIDQYMKHVNQLYQEIEVQNLTDFRHF
jgi:hypothetical protein